MKNNLALVYSGYSSTFALVDSSLAVAMMTTGNTEGFNRVCSNPKPQRIVIQQTGPGKCDVELHFIGLTLKHSSGRVAAKKLASALHNWTKAPVFNQKKGRNGFAGRLVECPQ